MKSLLVIAVAAAIAVAVTMPMPTFAAVGQPVLGKESVDAYVGIDTAGVASWARYEQTTPQPTTPFVLTRGTSNVVHGMPSNPVLGGNIAPFSLDSSNQLSPANTPLNLLNRADAQGWDKKSFAYALGNGPSFAVGAAATAWNQTASAFYRYNFEHINQTAQREVLSAISLHVDPGVLFLIPRFAPGGDFGSQYTDIQASFAHGFRVDVENPSLYEDGWQLPELTFAGSSAAVITLRGPQTFGVGRVLTFPPGLNQLANSIAVQNIPEQTLTLPQFDLLPGQRLTVSVQMSVSAFALGTGPAPIFYVLAGDPLSLTAGTATPNILLTYAPVAQVPEPQTWALMLAGLAACLQRWRRLASLAPRAAAGADRSLDRACTNSSSTLTRPST